jgi:hypothetical protein
MRIMDQTAAEWAREEFGRAQLGNALRRRRLIAMATQVAQSPGGLLSTVFSSVGERVGAYRFVENERIDVRAILDSCAAATIERALGARWLYVAVDGSSLHLADPSGRRRLGVVGAYRKNGRGLKVMSSIGIHPNGTSLGLLDLQWWTRHKPVRRNGRRERRPLAQKETRFWLQAMERVEAAFQQAQTALRPWFQLDREGDFHDLLRWMSQTTPSRVTVRAAQNRRVASGECGYLWDALQARPPSGEYHLPVAAGPKRQARTARMVIRWAPVTLLLRDRRTGTKKGTPVDLWAVLVQETGTTPAKERPLSWLLITNAPVHNLAAAIEVIQAYAYRWRIEDYHRTWKSQCGVEHSQLHSVDHLMIWATLLASVAMRIERLKHLARTEPDTPASVEFSREEIDAVIVLRQPSGYRRGDMPNIGQVVRWVADLGGYIGPSNGPPGSTVIGRGLKRVEPVILALRYIGQEKPD